jgi:predicted nucleic acid-binding protein
VADFDAICATEYQLVELTSSVVEQARLLLEHHPLRAYDAVQLASALVAQHALQSVNLLPLTFLSADDRLLVVAQAEGLVTDNPNTHP